MLPLIIYCLCEIQAVLDFRTTHTFVRNKFSPITRLAYAKFGLLFTAGKHTFQAVTQWCSKTESQIVFCVYKMPERPIPVAAQFNPLTLNDPYNGRTAPLTSKRCILYIYSTNTGTEYFKHSIYSPFLSLQNAVCFIILTYLVPVLFTFYIQSVLKFKKIIPAPKG